MTEKKGKKIDIRDKKTFSKSVSEEEIDDAVEIESATGQAEADLEKRLEAAECELKDTYDRLLRISAEFENYKKRISRETEEFKKYANESMVTALLPVVDNLERAINAFGENHQDQMSLLEGVSLTHAEILKILEKFNVTAIDAVGLPFDPNFHEAVMQEPSKEHPGNTVIQELQKGYIMHNRLIRPAMVIVSK